MGDAVKFLVSVTEEFDPRAAGMEFKAELFEDLPSGKTRFIAVAYAGTEEDALLAIKRKRDAFRARREPKWYRLEDVPEPQSVKAV